MKLEVRVKNEEEVEALGFSLAKRFKKGDVAALIGDLGTGKTTLSKAIAKGLGVSELVTSPTFTIVQEYKSGRLPLYHFDVYRIESEEEMFDLGYEEYFFGDGVCIVEWADQILSLIPSESVIIEIEYSDDPEKPEARIYRITLPEEQK